ncbi:MAG: hypothetical protein QHH02_04660, partial [Syntrophomonadaceae bacterium]|nr:hypothetical protein [Syntrophomonadaceae bacterium]
IELKDVGESFKSLLHPLRLEKIQEHRPFYVILKNNSYSKKPVTVKSHTGYQIEWTAIFDNQQALSAREYFLQKKDRTQVLRISMFAPQRAFPPKLEKTLDTIISSTEWD